MIEIKQKSIVIWTIFILMTFQSVNCTEMNENFTIEPILSTDICHLGEGPHWDGENQCLYYVDAFKGFIHRFDEKNGLDSKIKLDDIVTIVIPVANETDSLLVSLRNKVVKLNWNTEKYEVIAECAPENNGNERFNDGKIDAAGRLWIGTLLTDSKGIVQFGGSLYKLENGQFVKMADNFTLSNGMAWNSNNTLMYFNDSKERKTWMFDFNLTTGTLNNRRLFLDFDQHPNLFCKEEFPDGMFIDSEDFLWIAMYGGARVIRINPETKQIVNSIKIPAPQTTSLAFGGKEFDEIFVTSGDNSSADDNTRKNYPHAGRIFKVKTNNQFKGTKAFNFKL